MKFDLRNAEGLKNLSLPQTGAKLSQFVNCLQWMAISIPRFSERVHLLREIVEKAYKKSGKRTSKSIKNIKLHTLGWTDSHKNNFDSLKSNLYEAIKLTYPDNTKAICTHTGASESVWAEVVTLCDPEDIPLAKAPTTT